MKRYKISGCRIRCEMDSKELIGDVERQYRLFKQRCERNPFPEESDLLWRAYYNGWIEGRADILKRD